MGKSFSKTTEGIRLFEKEDELLAQRPTSTMQRKGSSAKRYRREDSIYERTEQEGFMDEEVELYKGERRSRTNERRIEEEAKRGDLMEDDGKMSVRDEPKRKRGLSVIRFDHVDTSTSQDESLDIHPIQQSKQRTLNHQNKKQSSTYQPSVLYHPSSSSSSPSPRLQQPQVVLLQSGRGRESKPLLKPMAPQLQVLPIQHSSYPVLSVPLSYRYQQQRGHQPTMIMRNQQQQPSNTRYCKSIGRDDRQQRQQRTSFIRELPYPGTTRGSLSRRSRIVHRASQEPSEHFSIIPIEPEDQQDPLPPRPPSRRRPLEEEEEDQQSDTSTMSIDNYLPSEDVHIFSDQQQEKEVPMHSVCQLRDTRIIQRKQKTQKKRKGFMKQRDCIPVIHMGQQQQVRHIEGTGSLRRSSNSIRRLHERQYIV